MASSEEIIINAILAGTREYLANAQRIAGANVEIGRSAEMMGRSFDRTTRRGFLMNQMLFTARRLMFGMTLAVVGSGLVVTKWGHDFNSAMQQARVALQPVSADIGGVQNRLNKLWNFTKFTPFQFKDMTIAFRQLYFGTRTLGISADMTQQTLKSIVDALSATGRTSPGALNRVAVALQHVAYQGVLTGQAINQLNRDGIPATAILAKMFGLTGEQIHNVRKQGIPTMEFLRRMNLYIESTPGLMNAAHRQAIGTFHGLFTTFRDNLSQIMGEVEKGWFKRMQGFFARANDFFNRVGASHPRSMMGLMTGVNNELTPGSNGVLIFWTRLSEVVRRFWQVLSTLLGDLFKSQIIWGTIYVALTLVYGVLKFLTPQTHFLANVIQILIPFWVAWYTYTKLNAFWLGILRFEEAMMTRTTKEMTFAQFMANLIMGRFGVIAKINTALIWLQVRAMTALSAESLLATTRFGTLTSRMWGLRNVLGLIARIGVITLFLELIPHAKRNPDPNAASNNPFQRQLTRIPVAGGLFSQVGRAADWLNYETGIAQRPHRARSMATSGLGTDVSAAPRSGLGDYQPFWQRMPPIEVNLKLRDKTLESITVDAQSGRAARR